MEVIFMYMQVLYVFSGRLQVMFGYIKVSFIYRQDFMVIPFQAIEVYLDNVVPADSKSL